MFRWCKKNNDTISTSTTKGVAMSAPEQSITRLRESIENQEKREKHLQNKINDMLLEAKARNQKGDKRGALFALKKKKLYENEMEKIQNVKMTLETQIFHVESSVYNFTTVQAMSEGTKTMKKIHAQTGIDKIEDILDDIREESEIGRELNTALGQPLDACMMDDDELLAELERIDTTSGTIPTKNSSNSNTNKMSMPIVPNKKIYATTTTKLKDEQDLRNLELELSVIRA